MKFAELFLVLVGTGVILGGMIGIGLTWGGDIQKGFLIGAGLGGFLGLIAVGIGANIGNR